MQYKCSLANGLSAESGVSMVSGGGVFPIERGSAAELATMNCLWLVRLLLLPLAVSFRCIPTLSTPWKPTLGSSLTSSHLQITKRTPRFHPMKLFEKKMRLPVWITPEERKLSRTFLQEKKDIPFSLIYRGANKDIDQLKLYLKSVFLDDFIDVEEPENEHLAPILYNIQTNANESLQSTKSLFDYHTQNNRRDYCIFAKTVDQKVFIVFNHYYHDARSLGTIFQGNLKADYYKKAYIPKYFTKRETNISEGIYHWNEPATPMKHYHQYHEDSEYSVWSIGNKYLSSNDYIFWKTVAFISQSIKSIHSSFRIFVVPSTRKILQKQLTLATSDYSCLTYPLQFTIPYPRETKLRLRCAEYCQDIRKNKHIFRFQKEYDQYYHDKPIDNVHYGPVFQYHSYLDNLLCYLEKFELVMDTEALIPYWGHFLKDTVMVTEDGDGLHRILYTNILPPAPKINPRNAPKRNK